MIHVQIARDYLGSLYVLALRRLIATAQKDNHDISAMNEIDAITWALINTKLANSVEKLCVSKKASLQTHNTLSDACPGSHVLEVFKPIPENCSLAHVHCLAPEYSENRELQFTNTAQSET
jgi:hypothetical protein